MEEIWNYIAGLPTPGFFITADILRQGASFPASLGSFIGEKLGLIGRGIPARKFVFQAEGWRIHLTFFPTDRVVDERYALKNKVMKLRRP